MLSFSPLNERVVANMIDIRELPEVVEIINSMLNDGKIIELKNESHKKDTVNVTVVEINRILRTKKPNAK